MDTIATYEEISTLLSITLGTAQKYCADARQHEVKQQKATVWDMWLDCHIQQQIADEMGIDHHTVKKWIGEFQNEFQNSPPDSRQHFDIWQFTKADGDSTYFGQMPPQVVENVLWFYTEPGQIVFDPFAGGGTTIKVAKEMLHCPLLGRYQCNWEKYPRRGYLIIVALPSAGEIPVQLGEL